MFLRSARMADFWAVDRPCAAARAAPRAGQAARAHAVCALRLLLLVPVAACVVAAWLVATALTVVWVVVVTPLRGRGGTTAD